jgi:pimeloyl-ACP methyl ester carboxylesterase
MSNPHAHVADHFITINGLNIHYRVWGDPRLPPLVILHGLEAHSHTWDHVAIALADRYHIIVPDLRGHGQSSWAPEYSWRLILEDTLKLMDGLGLRQTVLCGHSLGGRVAYMLASQYPERVTCLVIVEADPMDRTPIEAQGGGSSSDIDTYATFEHALAEAYRRQPYADKDALRHEVQHGMQLLDDGRWTRRMDPALYSAARRGQLNPGTRLEWPALAQIRCPSVLIYGAHSIGKGGSMQKPGIAAAIAEAIPDCQLIEIPDAAHDLPNENPAGFISGLRAYLVQASNATLKGNHYAPKNQAAR